MQRLLMGVAIGLLLYREPALAEISFIQGSNGTTGTIIDLGGGFRSYSDSHGRTGTIVDLGGGFQTFQFSAPHGGLHSGTILTLPTPSPAAPPPQNLSPAPMLPFTPKGPLMPREPAAPPAPFAPAYGSGRFGR
jgi:hypothetical protein